MQKETSYLKVSTAEFTNIIEKGLIIVDFGSDWCGRSRLMNSLIDPIIKKCNSKIEFIRIDLEMSKEIRISHNVYCKQTYLIFKDGAIIDRIDKLISQKEFETKINSYINGFK